MYHKSGQDFLTGTKDVIQEANNIKFHLSQTYTVWDVKEEKTDAGSPENPARAGEGALVSGERDAKGRADAEARAAHLAWAKKRALEYLDAGDTTNAVASMSSDLDKHPAWKNTLPTLGMLGIYAALEGPVAVRRWIDGFN